LNPDITQIYTVLLKVKSSQVMDGKSLHLMVSKPDHPGALTADPLQHLLKLIQDHMVMASLPRCPHGMARIGSLHVKIK